MNYPTLQYFLSPEEITLCKELQTPDEICDKVVIPIKLRLEARLKLSISEELAKDIGRFIKQQLGDSHEVSHG